MRRVLLEEIEGTCITHVKSGKKKYHMNILNKCEINFNSHKRELEGVHDILSIQID